MLDDSFAVPAMTPLQEDGGGVHMQFWTLL